MNNDEEFQKQLQEQSPGGTVEAAEHSTFGIATDDELAAHIRTAFMRELQEEVDGREYQAAIVMFVAKDEAAGPGCYVVANFVRGDSFLAAQAFGANLEHMAALLKQGMVEALQAKDAGILVPH